jgi:hypothetical protein
MTPLGTHTHKVFTKKLLIAKMVTCLEGSMIGHILCLKESSDIYVIMTQI